MQSSVQLQFLNMDPSGAGKTVVNKRVPRQDRANPNIMNCRLSVDALSQKKLHCGPYHPGIDIALPGKEIVVNHTPDSHHSDSNHWRAVLVLGGKHHIARSGKIYLLG